MSTALNGLWRTMAARAAVAFLVPSLMNGAVSVVLLHYAGPEALEITGPFGLIGGYGHLILAPYWLAAEIWGIYRKSYLPLRSYVAFIVVFYTVYGPVLVFAPFEDWTGFGVAYAAGSAVAVPAAWLVTWAWLKSAQARTARRESNITEVF